MPRAFSCAINSVNRSTLSASASVNMIEVYHTGKPLSFAMR